MSLSEVMRTTDYENVFCVPSNFRFADADTRLKAEIAGGVDTRLLYAIEDLIDETARSGERKFDYIIIDCGPRLDMTTTNASLLLKPEITHRTSLSRLRLMATQSQAFLRRSTRSTVRQESVVACRNTGRFCRR